MSEPQKALHNPEERAEQADRMIVEALDRMETLFLDMRTFDSVDDKNIFEYRGKGGRDGWPVTGLTPLGVEALKRTKRSATEAARALRTL